MSLSEKRKEIREVVIQALSKGHATLGSMQAQLRKVTIGELFEEEEEVKACGWAIPEIFDIKQGVTWGGEGCENIFVLDEKTALSLEPELVKKTIGGEDISPWKIIGEKYLLFPYIASGNKWVAAFRNPKIGDVDVLDFSITLHPYEKGKNILDILNFRTAQGIIPFPKTASYLVSNFAKLSQRIFEGKSLAEYNKSWYEYHRPRNPSILTSPKIVCKRMMKEPTFTLDDKGYLPRDSVICLIPKGQVNVIQNELTKIVGEPVNQEEVLNYILYFLNSTVFATLLAKRRAKKRGGYPIVDERLLQKFIIPKPSAKYSKEIKQIIKCESTNIDANEFYSTLSEQPQKRLSYFKS